MTGSRHHKAPQRLEQAEPSTVGEARAILKRIRVRKGYIEDGYRLDLEKLSSENRDQTLDLYAEKREMEAAFTTRFAMHLNPVIIS